MIAEKGITIKIDDVYFYGNQLENVKLNQETNPLSTELPISTCDFTIIQNEDVTSLFTAKKRFDVYFDGKLKAIMFVTDLKRTSVNKWAVQGEDYISFLEDTMFSSRIFEEDTLEYIISKFFPSNVPFLIAESLKSKPISGKLEATTCRDALMQMCFAIGGVVKTSNFKTDIFEGIEIAEYSIPLSKEISTNRVLENTTIKSDAVINSVSIAVLDSYTLGELQRVPNAPSIIYPEEGTILDVELEEPYGGYEIRRKDSEGWVPAGSGYEFLIRSAYRVKVKFSKNAQRTYRLFGCPITGVNFSTSRRFNENIPNSYIKIKDIDITETKLITENNVDEVLNRIFNDLIKTDELQCKITEGKHVTEGARYKYGEAKYGAIKYGERKPSIIEYDTPINLGDILEFELNGYGTQRRRLVKQTYSLSGSAIVKDCVLK